MTTPPVRPRTDIDQACDEYVDTIAALDPIDATYMGVAGHDHKLTDYSPAGVAARADAARAMLTRVDALPVVDDVDAVTVAALHERLDLELELAQAHELDGELNNIDSPLQRLRDVFDLTAADTADDWHVIAQRMAAVAPAIDQYIDSFRAGAACGHVPAQRQVGIGIAQARDLAGPGSFFPAFAASARPDGAEPAPALAKDLAGAAAAAASAYGHLASFLETELMPLAGAADGVGADRYRLWSRYFLGAQIDLEETYQWGLAELARIVAEQEAVAARIAGPGASVEEAVAVLDADPARVLSGTDALKAWMQQTADQAIAELADTHFDIPTPVRRLECLIAPTNNGGIYYTGPSEDFSRPGRMWWSVPPGVNEFGTWREKTTVYHEGVPGHHLQIAQTVYRAELLNRWRRLATGTSGHAEGWALYAERLMADLGYLDDPGDRLGMLDGQRMRAARVVLDIGVHLGLACPEEWGGGTWDADKAWTFFARNVNMAEGFLRFEVDRYLGWPGQAPSYKVGQRLWERARDQAEAAATAKGQPFSLKDFHRRALDLGSLGLDVLIDALR